MTYPAPNKLSEGCRSVSDSPAKNASSDANISSYSSTDVEDMKDYLYKALGTWLVREWETGKLTFQVCKQCNTEQQWSSFSFTIEVPGYLKRCYSCGSKYELKMWMSTLYSVPTYSPDDEGNKGESTLSIAPPTGRPPTAHRKRSKINYDISGIFLYQYVRNFVTIPTLILVFESDHYSLRYINFTNVHQRGRCGRCTWHPNWDSRLFPIGIAAAIAPHTP